MSDMGVRVTIRLDDASAALLEAEAARCGVALGALVRESAVRAARDVGREVSAGRVKLRGRSVRLPVAGAGRNFSGVEAASGDSRGDPQPACPAPPVDPGVARALAFRRVTQVDRPRVDADFGPSDSI